MAMNKAFEVAWNSCLQILRWAWKSEDGQLAADSHQSNIFLFSFCLRRNISALFFEVRFIDAIVSIFPIISSYFAQLFHLLLSRPGKPKFQCNNVGANHRNMAKRNIKPVQDKRVKQTRKKVGTGRVRQKEDR